MSLSGPPHRPLRLARRPWLAAALLAALALAAAGCARPPAPPEGYRPNVVVVLVDALRADRLGVDGYPLPTTPHIDRLAGEGVHFAAALAHSTWTKPSIATLFTSLYPSQHGIQRSTVEGEDGLRTEVLDEALVTLAERLRGAGYRTGAVINQVHLRSRYGFAQGFDEFQQPRGKNAFHLNRRLEGWLEGIDRDRPFFAYLHYLDLHWPFTSRLPEHDGLFGPTEMKATPPVSGQQVPAWGARLDDVDDLRALVARYDHEVAYTDAAVGDLVERLGRLGLYEETLLVVTSDHGEAFLEHGVMGHGFAPYEELVRIPLVIRLPPPLRLAAGRIETPVGLVDLMPTLLEVAAAEPEPQCRGESFAPLLRGGELPDRVHFFETFDAFAARSRSRKLIRFDDGRLEHYDLAADPGELEPLPPPCAGPCAELAERLRAFRRLMLEARAASPAETAALERQDVEALRSLGYLD